MIHKDRLEMISGLMSAAKEILSQYQSVANIANQVIKRMELYAQNKPDPKELIDMFKRVHDMQMESIKTINSILEKFPVEHTVQELLLIDLFRKFSESQKHQFMSALEKELKVSGRI